MKKLLLILIVLAAHIQAANDSLITAVINKYSVSYASVTSYSFVKHQKMVITDKDDPQDKEEMVLKANVTSSFYGLPTEELFYYEKDGKPLSVDEYKKRKPNLPPYPLFDKDSEKHYSFSFEKEQLYKGNNVRRYSFIPKKNEERYLKGYVLIDTTNVQPVFVSYTMVETSFPMKSMSGTNDLLDVKGALLPKNITFKGVVHIPFLYPNKIVEGSISLDSYKLF